MVRVALSIIIIMIRAGVCISYIKSKTKHKGIFKIKSELVWTNKKINFQSV